MPESAPEPLDGAAYEDVAARELAGWRAGLIGDTGARLVATVEATRRLVDELRENADAMARLNRALAELGMAAAALTLTSGRTALGWPVAVVQLVHAGEPDQAYGEIRIPFNSRTEA